MIVDLYEGAAVSRLDEAGLRRACAAFPTRRMRVQRLDFGAGWAARAIEGTGAEILADLELYGADTPEGAARRARAS